MNKRPAATARGWLGMCGMVMMLAMSACQSETIKPTPATQTKSIDQSSVNDDDPPEKPGKPGGEG